MTQPVSKLAKLRRINFLTLREVAIHLEMNLASYAKIERGKRGLSMQNAIKLKKLFKVQHIDELIDESESNAS